MYVCMYVCIHGVGGGGFRGGSFDGENETTVLVIYIRLGIHSLDLKC
jgi:hypothetical protein